MEFLNELYGVGVDGVMANLQAYFDESGKLKDPNEYVVFGGLAGMLDEVSVFSRKWRDLLGSDVDHIHMRDAMRFEGAFRGWRDKESKRDELLIECAKLCQSSSAMLIVSEMNKDDFNALSVKQKDIFKNPVYGGFEACVRALAASFPAHDLSIWYDESEDYAKTCLKMYQRMKSLNTDFARRLPSLTFGNNEKFPGLQAADIVAYCSFVVQRDGESAPRVVREMHSVLHRELNGNRHLLYQKGIFLGGGKLEA